MHLGLLAVLMLTLSAALPAAAQEVEDLGAHRFRGMDEFQRVIDTRCTVCHTRERVDIAIKKRRNLEKLQQRMLEQGAVITERDKAVLGTFWGEPMKSRKGAAEVQGVQGEREGLREYRRIIETRCVLCHSLERVETAIENRLPFESVEEILLKRNVVLTAREREVLGTFWGNPLKNK
jgi:uncharacterized membrane protein